MNTAHAFQAKHNRLWRFVQFPLTRIVIATVLLIVTVLVLQAVAGIFHFKPVSLASVLLAVVLTSAALMAAYVVYVHLIERRPAMELGTHRAVREFAAGLLVGGALFCAVMLVLWLSGVVTIVRGAGWSAAISALLTALELAVIQVIFFWGIVFRIVEERLGTWIALALSIILFGAAHMAGPGASWISETIIGVEAGALLAAVYVCTRRLWMPIGVLGAVNFAEGGVFGVSIPGHDETGIWISRFHGPAILTGGAAGPEAGVLMLLICVAIAALFFVLSQRKGHIVAPFWRRIPIAASTPIQAD